MMFKSNMRRKAVVGALAAMIVMSVVLTAVASTPAQTCKQPIQIENPCYWEYNWIKPCSYFQPNCPSAKDELYYRRWCCYSGGHYGCGEWQFGGGCCE